MFPRLRVLADRITAFVGNAWRYNSADYYIAEYEGEFRIIARALRIFPPFYTVWPRVLLEPARVEFRSYAGTIASVEMHGEVGRVYRTIVRGPLTLSQRMLFEAALPKVEFQEALAL